MKLTRKITFAGLLIALSVTMSAFSIPIGITKCFPVQHMVNVIAGVALGPAYAVVMAFVTSLIRLMLGTGTLLAFPGSMAGALCCGLLYKRGKKLWLAFTGEVFGTGIIGALLAYPIARFIMGKESAVLGFVLPFLSSTALGALIAVVLIKAVQKTGILNFLQKKEGNSNV